MARTFEAGQEVYLEDGQMAEFCAAIPGGYVVRPLYESDDDEPYYGDTRTVAAVFAKPPKPRLDEESARARAELEAIETRIEEAHDRWNAFQNEERLRQDRLKKHNILQTVDDFLQGRITHVVRLAYWDGPAITDLREETDTADSFRVIQLQALRRPSEGPLRWAFGEKGREGIPCSSLEQAQEYAAAELADRIQKERGSASSLRQLSLRARSLRLPFPEWAQRMVDDLNLREASEKVRVHRQQLAAAEAALNALPIHAAPEPEA